jgi:DNA repair exonuclease SbcCD nuclease subunit
MKIPILTDTHFGVRNDSALFLDYFMDFFHEVFFPYVEQNGISVVIHAGDILDRRKYVNFSTLNRVGSEFLDVLFKKHGIVMHCIPGNHDTYYKNTNDVNCMKELFAKQYPDNFIYYDKPEVINLNGMDIALLPWINQDNEKESLEFIKTAAASWLVGHLELKGFEVLRGVIHEFGMDHKIFDRYEQVLSGHYHIRNEKDNVKYLGSPYQMTFNDAGDVKGFWVIDTDTRDLEFIENPKTMFHVLRYDDSNNNYENMKSYCSQFEKKYVKIFVAEKTKPQILDELVDTMYSEGVHNLTVIEDVDSIVSSESDGQELSKSTIELLMDEIKTNPKITNQERVQKLVKELYLEALRT